MALSFSRATGAIRKDDAAALGALIPQLMEEGYSPLRLLGNAIHDAKLECVKVLMEHMPSLLGAHDHYRSGIFGLVPVVQRAGNKQTAERRKQIRALFEQRYPPAHLADVYLTRLLPLSASEYSSGMHSPWAVVVSECAHFYPSELDRVLSCVPPHQASGVWQAVLKGYDEAPPVGRVQLEMLERRLGPPAHLNDVDWPLLRAGKSDPHDFQSWLRMRLEQIQQEGGDIGKALDQVFSRSFVPYMGKFIKQLATSPVGGFLWQKQVVFFACRSTKARRVFSAAAPLPDAKDLPAEEIKAVLRQSSLEGIRYLFATGMTPARLCEAFEGGVGAGINLAVGDFGSILDLVHHWRWTEAAIFLIEKGVSPHKPIGDISLIEHFQKAAPAEIGKLISAESAYQMLKIGKRMAKAKPSMCAGGRRL